MEAPVDFEIWGTVVVPLVDAADVYVRHNPAVSRSEALRILVQSRSLQTAVALAAKVRWVDCASTLSSLESVARGLNVYQSGWGEDRNAIWCPHHQLYFGGCLGCPVCDPGGRVR